MQIQVVYTRRKKRNRNLPILLAILLLLVFLLGLSLLIRSCTAPRIIDGILPENAYGLPVYTALVDPSQPGRTGIKREIKYIVIHETGNPSKGADAERHAAYLQSGGEGSTAWHYTVDDTNAFHHIPDDEIAFHAGDGQAKNGGNQCGIGIELCVNSDGDFEITFDNAARLTAYLLDAYDLQIRDVKQHADFMDKNCPETIREQGRWEEFLKLVKDYQKQNGGNGA